jgi:hypothetical protein
MRCLSLFTVTAAIAWMFLPPHGAESAAVILLAIGVIARLWRSHELAPEAVDHPDSDCAGQAVSESL